MRMVLIFCMIILQLMCVRVCRVLAEVPTTPKILFTSRTGCQLRNLHDESGWLRTGEPDTASRR